MISPHEQHAGMERRSMAAESVRSLSSEQLESSTVSGERHGSSIKSSSRHLYNELTRSFVVEDAASEEIGFHSQRSIASEWFEEMNLESLKTKVRSMNENRKDPMHNSYILMESRGLWQAIAKHYVFINITLCVIACNAVWIAIDTDWNKTQSLADADTIFIFMENLFCAYFLFEWVVRLLAFKNKLEGFLKDAWFAFDSLLLAMMITETWVVMLVGGQVLDGTAVLRLFRLLRLSRLVRLLRSLPELIILIRGIFTAMRTVLYVMCLLILVTYIFAIALTTLADGTTMGTQYFDNVLLSMYSLLVYATLIDELASFCDAIRAESEVCLVVVLIFVCLSCLTLMNMLVGVLCEVISAVAVTEKKEIAATNVTTTLEKLALELDENFDGFVSFHEFQHIMGKPEALKALRNVDIAPEELLELGEMFFATRDRNLKELSFGTFMDSVLELRHAQHARLRDIRAVWNDVDPKTREMKGCLSEVNSRFQNVEQGITGLRNEVALLAAKIK